MTRRSARQSIRNQAHDFAAPRWYHVTICAAERGRQWGLLANRRVVLSLVGRIIVQTWTSLPERMPHLRQDAFILMPDHLHALIRIWPEDLSKGFVDSGRRFGASQAGALSLVVNLFKGDVTRQARKDLANPSLKIWQRGYHERIIRNQAQMDATRAYIRNNPIRG